MFNWLDYLLIGFFVFGAVMGIVQGYRWQLFRIGCLIFAYFLALFFNNTANNLFARWFTTENTNYLGYVSIFFGTLLITFFIGLVIAKTKAGNTTGGRRITGLILGVVRNVIFCSIIITYLWLLGTERERKPINNSTIATNLRTGSTFTIYKLPQQFLGR